MAASDAAAPPFPDCWIAYGATDAELQAYGGASRPLTGAAWAVFVGQVAVLSVLGLMVASAAPIRLRGIAGGAAIAVGGSAVVSALRLVATVRALTPGREHLGLGRASGPAEAAPWEQIGEIALAELPRRQAVGLRLRPGTGGRLPAPSGRSPGGCAPALTSCSSPVMATATSWASRAAALLYRPHGARPSGRRSLLSRCSRQAER